MDRKPRLKTSDSHRYALVAAEGNRGLMAVGVDESVARFEGCRQGMRLAEVSAKIRTFVDYLIALGAGPPRSGVIS
jgi:hypothetical protein